MTRPSVVNVSGHMIDTPDRTTPRFPATEEPRVTSEIRRVFDQWDVGPGTVLVTGGARGTDLIAAEQALELGADVALCLAHAPDEFVRRSVDLPGSEWAARFEAVRAAATDVSVLTAEQLEAHDSVYVASNAWMVETGKRYASTESDPRALIVWAGSEGDGPGGTRDFCVRLGLDLDDLDDLDEDRVAIIDPTPRCGELE